MGKAGVICTHSACYYMNESTHMPTHILVQVCVYTHYNKTLRKHRGGREHVNLGC